MQNQFFLVDKNDAGFSALETAINSHVATKYGTTPTVVQRPASHDSSHVVIKFPVTETELDADSGLAPLRTANYPNALCRHRWSNRENFRALGGQHMIGLSERSFERDRSGNPMSGREAIFIRKQQGTGGSAGDGSLQDYGENSDGSTHYDAANGMQDPVIDRGALGDAVWNKGKSYFICDGAHVRFASHDNSGNPDQANGIGQQGLIKVENASAADADKIYVYCDWDMMPAMLWGSWTEWERYHPDSVWELYDATNNIWVMGRYQIDGTSYRGLAQTALCAEADIDDVTQDAETLFQRHFLQGHATFSDLNGTGGRGRFHVRTNDKGASQNWDAVHVWNGSSFTDVTIPANDATTDDFEILPVSAPDGAAIYFVASDVFGTVMMNLSQVQVGGTGVWEYSLGSDTWAQFNNIKDPTLGFTSGLGSQNIYFNPVIDWATDTVNGNTGYIIRWRKTGGTVTTAARGDQTQVKFSAIWVHRWNDTAPTRGPCHYGNQGTFGMRLNLPAGEGNIEFVRLRQIGPAQQGSWLAAEDVVLTGCQFGLIGQMTFNSGTPSFTFRSAAYGARYWSIADHIRQDKTHSGIQRIIDKINEALVWMNDVTEGAQLTSELNGHVPDPTAFDDMPDWCDIWASGDGPYGSGGISWTMIFDGCKVRQTGGNISTLNDTNVLNLDTTDNHSLAFYGQLDSVNCQYNRIAFEKLARAFDFYSQATGGTDAPVVGSASYQRNAILRYGYCDTLNDSAHATPLGIQLEQDNDTMAYEDGSGGQGGMELWFWDFDSCERGFVCTYDNAPGLAITIARFLTFNNLSKYCYAAARNFGPEATNAVTFDGTSTYNDITSNILPSVATATAIFAAGSAGNKIYVGVNVRPTRRFSFNVTTAGVGSPTLAFRYHNGTSWTAVSNLSDGTNGFSTTGENVITWDRPTDQQAVAVNGVTKYWIEIEIVSGSFSTVPQCSTIKGRRVGPSLDIKFWEVWNVPTDANVGRTIGGFWTSDSGILLDDYGKINLSGSQSASTPFYKIATGGDPVPDKTLADWQALVKSKVNTDAEQDSVFGPNHMLIAA